MKKQAVAASVDEYIQRFRPEVQAILRKVRKAIRERAPSAVERISYQMPAYSLNGILVYFAAFQEHVGFYPTSSGVAAFESELTGYVHGKGSIQFPLDEPMPLDLIRRMVDFRVAENTKGAQRGGKGAVRAAKSKGSGRPRGPRAPGRSAPAVSPGGEGARRRVR